MSIQWIAIVNRTGAQLYSEKTFRLVGELKNSLGREKNRAMTDDRPGLARSRFIAGSTHSMTGEKNPHEDAAVAFARRVASFLRKQFSLKKFDKLLMVC